MHQVIYAWNYKEWGGVQIYFLALIKEVRRTYRVIVTIPENSDQRIITALTELGAEIEYTPPAPPPKTPKGLIQKLLYRYKTIASENRMISTILRRAAGNDTIVHIDFGFWQSLIPLLRLLRHVNVFVTQHTALDRQKTFRHLIWKMKGRTAASLSRLRFFAENNDARKSLAPYIGVDRVDDVRLTYAGYDPDEIETVVSEYPGDMAIRRKYSVSDAPLMVTVGQFIVRKGCWTVLEALQSLVKCGREFTFLWLATAPLSGEAVSRVESYGLGKCFRVISASEMEDFRLDPLTILLASDIFVLASLQEGLPIALIEAMALGRACVATNVNAIPEAIESGKSGILIDPNDAAGLAGALADLLDDPARRKQLGEAARAVAFARFNEKKMAEATLSFYDEVWQATQ